VRRCGREPSVLAWDIVNEPEWVTFGIGRPWPFATVWRRAMREFIAASADAVHRETQQQATVGLASWRGLPLVRGLGLDFYQVHWYDRHQWRAPLERPVAVGLDRPMWLGEYPTAGSKRTPESIVAMAKEAGYSAALAWSAEAVDGSSRAG
jgi:hypothetical protein